VRDVLLWGSGERELEFKLSGPRSSYQWRGVFEGVITSLERKYKETDSEMVRAEIERYMSMTTCPTCEGKRLRPEALAVKVGGLDLHQVSKMPVAELRKRVVALEAGLTARERRIAEKILKEVLDRVGFLEDVGVGYLSLERASATLSGGESQRIRLATQIGSKLMGVLYVLDEPSIGLHQRDNAKLIATLKGMRDLGNSVLVVEHDEETILAADWVIDLGPGAGDEGGTIVAQGTPAEVVRAPRSVTARYLARALAPVRGE
jgi:excinuclease ABC subunit A